jgi:hypothetical protein
MSAAAVSGPRRELARRGSGGVEVTLYWDACDNGTSIEVCQRATNEIVAFAVPPKRALDAFYHPFAHLPTTSSDSLFELGGENR